MKYGVAIFPTDSSISPVEIATACESRGFESIWFPEHSHIPAARPRLFQKRGHLSLAVDPLQRIVDELQAEGR